MSKAFASQADLQDKKITFEQLSPHCWAYTAEGDPNSGVIIGDKYIMVSDATATPAMARDLIAKIRTVSDKPIKYVLLTHYHAVRVLGASAYEPEQIIASQKISSLDLARFVADTFGYPMLDLATFDEVHIPTNAIDRKLIAAHRVILRSSISVLMG